MKHWIISSLFVVLACACHGQPPDLIFKHLNRTNGLLIDAVSCLALDSTGFIWIGSQEGLFRYDGFSYKSFYYQPGNNQTIPNNYISKIFVDKEGLVWVATSGGLIALKNSGEVVQLFTAETEKNFSKEGEKIFDIGQSGDLLWVTTADGLFFIHKRKGKFLVQRRDLKKDFSAPTNELGPFTIDNGQRLWICTRNGVMIFDPARNTLLHSGNNPSSSKILADKSTFRSIYINNNKVHYTTWEPAEKIFDQQTNEITTIYNGSGSSHPDYSYMVSQYLVDDHGTVWISSGKGIKMVSGKNEYIFRHRTDNSYSLADDDVTSLLMDKENNLWVGTMHGISITQPYRHTLVNLSINNADKFPFSGLGVNAIIPVDMYSFLVGTGKGIYRTDETFHVQEHYSFGLFEYDWIWNNYCKMGDSILIPTQKGNLIYHIGTKKIQKLVTPPFDKFKPIFSFEPDWDGNIWMSRYFNDFLQYNPQTKAYKQYGLSQMGEPAAVLKLLNDRENNLWLLSSSSGVLKFDKAAGRITERLPLDKKNGLLDTHIIFALDVGEEILIGYVYHGISLYNKKKKTFRHFSHADGLASNSVTDAVQTDKNTAWIATRNGISRLDLATKTILSYGYENGILQNDFSCIAQLPDGRLAAGNSSGLVYFDPDHIKATQQVKSPVITSVNVYGSNLPVDFSSAGQPLSIDYDKNYFSLEYISLQYSNNQQIEYAYKLEGLDKDWINAGSRRFVSYSNLPGDHYVFRLKARLPGGNWVESKTLFPIWVSTPLFKKWWFIPLCALALLCLGYVLFRYRVQQLLKVEKMRQSISSDLHDEVGASLSSISIFSEMAKQSLSSEPKVESYLQRIGDRSRESIEKMSDIIWSINPDNDTMQQMLARMKTFVNETVDGKDITIHWLEDEAIKSLKLEMMQRKNFYLLFKEAFINAVKYSFAKNIRIELGARHNVVFLQVIDDGKGFCIETTRQGNGLKNMKQRALLLGGKTVVESDPGKGTSVMVQFRH